MMAEVVGESAPAGQPMEADWTPLWHLNAMNSPSRSRDLLGEDAGHAQVLDGRPAPAHCPVTAAQKTPLNLETTEKVNMNNYVKRYGCRPKIVAISEAERGEKRLCTLRNAAWRLRIPAAVLRQAVGDGDLVIYRTVPRDDYRVCILDVIRALWGEPVPVAASGSPG